MFVSFPPVTDNTECELTGSRKPHYRCIAMFSSDLTRWYFARYPRLCIRLLLRQEV
jgi:hypothetical protein